MDASKSSAMMAAVLAIKISLVLLQINFAFCKRSKKLICTSNIIAISLKSSK